MHQERDERWVYVALGILAIAYLVYRLRGSIDIDLKSLGKYAGGLAYVVPTLFAVVFGLWNRKRTAAMREEWEKQLLAEGLTRQESRVKTRIHARRGGGSLAADLRLTRVALYIFDTGGRREPMRFPFHRATAGEAAITGVDVGDGSGPTRQVRISLTGPTPMVVEFVSSQAGGWLSDIRGHVGRDAVPATPAPGHDTHADTQA